MSIRNFVIKVMITASINCILSYERDTILGPSISISFGIHVHSSKASIVPFRSPTGAS